MFDDLSFCAGLQQDLGYGDYERAHVKRVEMSELLSLKSHGGVDRALLSFDVDADLLPTFHWNLKQLFVFVLAEYESETNSLNQIILWDKIVENEKDARVRVDNKYIKYALVDQTNELRDTTVNLYLCWDHMPVTGRLFMDRGFGSNFTLPSSYR